jgi:hypothetical protein
MVDVNKIETDAKEEEESGKDVFSFRNPCNRFQMNGMDTKKHGGKEAGPKLAGGTLEQEKKQVTVQAMQNQINKMMGIRLTISYLSDKHVRKPSQRYPIAGFGGRKGPSDCGKIQWPLNLGIVGNVIGIVEVYEVSPGDGPKAPKGES